ncbi:unnamed protein product [Periconia digitata]|uniref:Uncharacterized protein n=1 Tax=Periconia digitata TaxID=1303443 RepID=A0A9W4U5Y2_9PLEO|nr:unnamed protein product [Periconia digitata]
MTMMRGHRNQRHPTQHQSRQHTELSRSSTLKICFAIAKLIRHGDPIKKYPNSHT